MRARSTCHAIALAKAEVVRRQELSENNNLLMLRAFGAFFDISKLEHKKCLTHKSIYLFFGDVDKEV